MPNTDPRQYQAPADVLADRVILVTGAGRGIGRAAAQSFAAHGASVILLGRTLSGLESCYDEIIAGGGPEPVISVMNLKKAGGPEYFSLAEQINNSFGRLDGLLHNASILGHLSPLENFDVSMWADVMHVNLTAAFVLTKTLMPCLRQSPDASVLFTTSSVGRKGRAYWGAYAVSKFGTEGLAQVLADETTETNIRVNCINPGRTRTSMRRKAYPGEDPNTLPAPEEILNAYLYLLGPDSRGVTGQSLDAQ